MTANRTIFRRLLSWLAGALLAVTAGAFLAGCGSSGYYYDYGAPGYYDYDYDDSSPLFDRDRGIDSFHGGHGDFDRGERGEHWGGHGGHWSGGHMGGGGTTAAADR
jgi:hypothetical protein